MLLSWGEGKGLWNRVARPRSGRHLPWPRMNAKGPKTRRVLSAFRSAATCIVRRSGGGGCTVDANEEAKADRCFCGRDQSRPCRLRPVRSRSDQAGAPGRAWQSGDESPHSTVSDRVRARISPQGRWARRRPERARGGEGSGSCGALGLRGVCSTFGDSLCSAAGRSRFHSARPSSEEVVPVFCCDAGNPRGATTSDAPSEVRVPPGGPAEHVCLARRNCNPTGRTGFDHGFHRSTRSRVLPVTAVCSARRGFVPASTWPQHDRARPCTAERVRRWTRCRAGLNHKGTLLRPANV
jgi:hypothetical protein